MKKNTVTLGVRKCPSVTKKKTNKLAEITNTPHVIKSAKSNAKSVKSNSKLDCNSIEVVKTQARNNSSVRLYVQPFQSPETVKDFEFHSQANQKDYQPQTSLIDKTTKGKMVALQQQVSFLLSINQELKSQVTKIYEQSLQSSKVQSSLREQVYETRKELDQELEKARVQGTNQRAKIKSMAIEIQQLKRTKQDEIGQLKAQMYVQLNQLEALKKELGVTVQQREKLMTGLANTVTTFTSDNGQKTQHIKQLEEELAHTRGKSSQIEKQQARYRRHLAALLRKHLSFQCTNVDSTDESTIESLVVEVGARLTSFNDQIQALRLEVRDVDSIGSGLPTVVQVPKESRQRLQLVRKCVQVWVRPVQHQPTLSQKIQETKLSLQYWKRKFDESKLQGFKFKKQVQSLEREVLRLSADSRNPQEELKQTIIAANKDVLIQDLKQKIVFLQHQKTTMMQEGSKIMEKLETFRQKVVYLEARIKESKLVKLEEPHWSTKGSSILQHSTIISHSNSIMSQSLCLKTQCSQTDRSGSKGLREYKGQTQSKLEQKFLRGTKFLQSPEPHSVSTTRNT